MNADPISLLRPALDQTLKPVEAARHAPGLLYTSPELYALEKDRIFIVIHSLDRLQFNILEHQFTLEDICCLDLFGGTRRQIEIADAQVDYQRFQLEAASITLATNVVVTAIQEASLRAQLAATEEIVAGRKLRLARGLRVFVPRARREAIIATETMPLKFERVVANAQQDRITFAVGNIVSANLQRRRDTGPTVSVSDMDDVGPVYADHDRCGHAHVRRVPQGLQDGVGHRAVRLVHTGEHWKHHASNQERELLHRQLGEAHGQVVPDRGGVQRYLTGPSLDSGIGADVVPEVRRVPRVAQDLE